MICRLLNWGSLLVLFLLILATTVLAVDRHVIQVSGCELETATELHLRLHLHNNSLIANLLTSSARSGSAASYFQLWLWGDSFLHTTLLSMGDVRFRDGLPQMRLESAAHYPALMSSHIQPTGQYHIRLKRLYEMASSQGDDLHTCELSLSPAVIELQPNKQHTLSTDSFYPGAGIWRYLVNSEDFNPLSVTSFSNLTFHRFSSNNTSNNFTMTTNAMYNAFSPTKVTRINRYGMHEWVRQCLRQIRYVMLGDSSLRRIASVLHSEVTTNPQSLVYNLKYQRLFFLHGAGIYHNLAADVNTVEYQLGHIPAQFATGTILRHLLDGNYSNIAQEGQYNIWVVNSGHYDLRDVDLDTYVHHAEELFPLLAQFQRDHNVSVIWNGNTPFSSRMKSWLQQEHRFNPVFALAEQRLQALAARHGILYHDQFSSLLPFYSYSCDTHHYLCPDSNQLYRSTHIGLVNADSLVNRICNVARRRGELK